jgi:serine/threonine protein kinase
MNFAITAQHEQLLMGRYRIGRLLGSGGFGAVYLATDERLHRPVAIKVCSTRRLPADEAQEAAQLFQTEALTLARLHHPSLTAIWDYFNIGDEWYLVMEYVPGETLRSLLQRIAGPLPQAEAIDYGRQLCSVLSYLHGRQPPVVFRDLKPANIMVTPEGRLKLIDFGIVRLFSPGKTADTVQFGTPGYAPPEQYGGQTEPRSDIYSLGVVLHQMLTGYNPASSPFVLPPARTINHTLPEALERLLARATAPEIEDRIPSAEQFSLELDAALRPTPAHTVPAPSVPATGTTRKSAAPAPKHRPVWTPGPRSLPSPPESSGIGRGLLLLALLVVLLGSIGFGAVQLHSHVNSIFDALRQQTISQIMPGAITSATTVVFTGPADDGSQNIYRTQLPDGHTDQLTKFGSNVHASQPAVSPDGKRIAFTKEIYANDADVITSVQLGNETGQNLQRSELWLMDGDGSNQRQLLDEYTLARSPAWSPDGQWLAVEVAHPGQEWLQHDLMLVNIETGVDSPLVASGLWEGGPTWSPTGDRVAYHARSVGTDCTQLFAIDVQSGTSQQLTDLRGVQCEPQREGDFWPDWSPDGSQIAFARKLGGREQLALLNFDTGTVELVVTDGGPASHPRWSTKGGYLLFQESDQGQTQLWSLNTEDLTFTKVNTGVSQSRLADWH